jgi:hypothetical protein
MPLIQRNLEVIQVGVTPGLVEGATSFVFDGSGNPAKPDYRGYEPVFFEYGGRSPMVKGVDYSWDQATGEFDFLEDDDQLEDAQIYTVEFYPYDPELVITSNIIDYTYFIRKINIPNIDVVVNPRNGPILERLNSFISQYEPECLTNILGYELYKALLTESSQRMTDLLNGCEFTDDDGVLRKWRGLIYYPKVSLIANYVYYKFQEDSAKQTTGVATTVAKSTSGESQSPEYKMLDAWNFFSEEVKELISFLWNKNRIDPEVYPEFNGMYYKVLAFSRSTNFLGI